ncbi:DUF427 domain-containing protein [Hwanghaeella sp.]|uniref:DUF427 domain-containing protein n=1 Tax=Hwanghaeella sp. TaxID=2605943 RepID=UPI003CCBEC2D
MTGQAQPSGGGNPAPGFRERPDHKVTREPFERIVEIRRNGVTLCKTEGAILVRETNHTPVLYVPLLAIDMDELSGSDHTTYCPFKGHACYWSISGGSGPGEHAKPAENAVWAYQTPYSDVAWLEGYAAFYADKVDTLVDGLAVDTTEADWPAKL